MSFLQGAGSSKQALKASLRTDKVAGQTVQGQAGKAFKLPARERESRLASETQEAADLGVPVRSSSSELDILSSRADYLST